MFEQFSESPCLMQIKLIIFLPGSHFSFLSFHIHICIFIYIYIFYIFYTSLFFYFYISQFLNFPHVMYAVL